MYTKILEKHSKSSLRKHVANLTGERMQRPDPFEPESLPPLFHISMIKLKFTYLTLIYTSIFAQKLRKMVIHAHCYIVKFYKRLGSYNPFCEHLQQRP